MNYFAKKLSTEEQMGGFNEDVGELYRLGDILFLVTEKPQAPPVFSKPLNKIFHKPVKNPYLDKVYKRHVMTLTLYPASLEKYIAVHQEVWPQIIKNMDNIGVYGMEIFLWNNQAFMIMDTRPDFDMEKDGEVWAAMPQEKEWQRYVAKFQDVNTNAQATEKWVLMNKV